MLTTNPYLHFQGNTEEAMNFYKAVFDGQFTVFQRFNDVPGSEKMPTHEQRMIIHISLDMGKGNILMATDSLESMGMTLNSGNNFHICIQAESVEEVDRIFGRLSVGGMVEMPLNETMWGAYFGMVRDKYDVQWMINYTYQNNK